jgi:hypothetical protein
MADSGVIGFIQVSQPPYGLGSAAELKYGPSFPLPSVSNPTPPNVRNDEQHGSLKSNAKAHIDIERMTRVVTLNRVAFSRHVRKHDTACLEAQRRTVR